MPQCDTSSDTSQRAACALRGPRQTLRRLCRRVMPPMLCLNALGSGCGDSTMRMEGDMKLAGDMKMEGDMRGTMKIEGPIQIQMEMQGPSIKYHGVYVSENLLKRVHVDSTRADWLLAVFGEPTSRAALEDGSEIWKWAYVPVAQEGSFVTLFSPSGGKDEPKVQTATTFVHLRDGVVIDKWRD